MIEETKYNKHGWKLKITKSKEDIFSIYQRSKYGCHTGHKPMYLRLPKEELKKLKKLINNILKEVKKK